VDIAVGEGGGYELLCPIIYNYRHSTELYLKGTLGSSEKTHDLHQLLQELKLLLKNKFNTMPPAWFENIVTTFNDFDPYGTTFRYGGSINIDEIYIDLSHVKTLMNWLPDSFQKIREQKMIA